MKRNRYEYDVERGMSQSARKMPELDASYIQIDEKTEAELIGFTYRFSSIINYFDLSNNKNGNWEYFFTSNPHILLEILNNENVYEYNFLFEKLTNDLKNKKNRDQQAEALEQIFIFLFDIILDMHGVYSKIKTLQESLFNKAEFNWHDKEIYVFYSQIEKWRDDAEKGYGKKFKKREWPTAEKPSDVELISDEILFSASSPISENTSDLISVLDNFFADLQAKFGFYVTQGRIFLKNIIKEKEEYFEPHLALFKVFLQLYKKLQNKINLISQKHIDLYYQNILGQKPLEEIADKVYLILTLGVNIDQYLLKKGVNFIAEFPKLKKTYTYRTTEEVVLNRAKLVALHNILITSSSNMNSGKNSELIPIEKLVYHSFYDLSGYSNPLEKKKSPLMLFGENQELIPSVNGTMNDANIGFLAGSEILYQPNGQRVFSVDLYLDKASGTKAKNYIARYGDFIENSHKVVSVELFKSAFNIEITSDAGWFALEFFSVKFSSSDYETTVVTYNFQLNEDHPAISIYNPEIHGGDYPSNIPLIKFLLNPNSFHNGYSFLQDIIIERIGFKMEVKDNSSIVLNNSFGSLTQDTPFSPFGPQASVNSFLDIQNENILNKHITSLSIKIEWLDLPSNPGGFEEYYKEYDLDFKNDDFVVGVCCSEVGRFLLTPPQQQHFKLFETHRKDDKAEILNPITTIENIDFNKSKFTNEMSLTTESGDIKLNSKKGILRLQLISPNDPFGYKSYPKIFSEVTINNSKLFSQKKPLPKQPFTPLVKKISLSYKLESLNILSKGAFDKKIRSEINIFHIYPYGFEKLFPSKKQLLFKIIPSFSNHRLFHIGITEINPGEEITIFFGIKDLQASQSIITKFEIEWKYLSHNEWYPFSVDAILDDTTEGLSTSGIVTFKLPYDISMENTIMPNSSYWISCEMKKDYNYSMELTSINANAVLVKRVLDKETLFEMKNLPREQITQAKKNIPEIVKIFQPYESFGGQQSETYTHFNTRISETLRMKQRNVTTRDLTQSILSKFPILAYVKCLANGFQDQIYKGKMDIQIIVVPKMDAEISSETEGIPFVDFHSLSKIASFVKSILPSDINIIVTNPTYEWIKIKCAVSFTNVRVSQKINACISDLNSDIKTYISPWLENGNSDDFIFKKAFHINDLINFIKKRPYVEYLTGVSILHFYKKIDPETGVTINMVTDSSTESISSISPTTPSALLVSMNEHTIKVVKEEKYIPIEPYGIGELKVGNEFYIKKESVKKTSNISQKNDDDSINTFTLTMKI